MLISNKSTPSDAAKPSTRLQALHILLRDALVHVDPRSEHAALPSSTALSNLASSDTSTELFPPISSVTLFKLLFVAATWIFLLTATPPVKLILRIFTCELSATPASAAPPRMLRTPGSTPASMTNKPRSRVESGFISLALEIRALLVARAGAAFMAKVWRGMLKALMVA